MVATVWGSPAIALASSGYEDEVVGFNENMRTSELIVSNPEDKCIGIEENATFSVEASGGQEANYIYQWYYAESKGGKGIKIDGATFSTYTVLKVGIQQDGMYFYCIVSDGQNEMESGRARLTVYSPLTVAITPKASMKLKFGGSGTFKATVSGYPSSYTYQWYFMEQDKFDKTFADNIENISAMSYDDRIALFCNKQTIIKGATSSSYKVTKVNKKKQGVYFCVVSNGIQRAIDLKGLYILSEQKISIEKFSDTLAKGSKGLLKAKTDGNGKITYKSDNKNVATISSKGQIQAKNYGTAKITITASETNECWEKSKTVKIKVVPKTAALTQVTSPAHKKLSLKWKKDKTVTGYEVDLSLKKNFKSNTIRRNYKASKTSTVIGNVPVKTYYVRIRSYKKIGKSKYYGNWSKAKNVKIK